MSPTRIKTAVLLSGLGATTLTCKQQTAARVLSVTLSRLIVRRLRNNVASERPGRDKGSDTQRGAGCQLRTQIFCMCDIKQCNWAAAGRRR